MSDRRLLLLILYNLLSDSIKYSDTGTIRITVAMEEDESGSLTVADEGLPISADQQQRIFEEFVRGAAQGRAGSQPVPRSCWRQH